MSTNNPQSWGSVRDGKWHATRDAAPSFTRETGSMCGIKFTPLNVTHGEKPDYVRPTAFCKLCERAVQ